MKKSTVIGSALAAILAAGTIAIPVCAASNPSDNASAYSYSTGKQSYETRMAEAPAWYGNEEDSVTAGYSFNTGSQTAQARNNAFAGMPTEDDVPEEELDTFFQNRGLGSGAAYEDSQYVESAKANYGYAKGQAANQQRHASFSASNG